MERGEESESEGMRRRVVRKGRKRVRGEEVNE